jgi:hypothetical protein
MDDRIVRLRLWWWGRGAGGKQDFGNQRNQSKYLFDLCHCDILTNDGDIYRTKGRLR